MPNPVSSDQHDHDKRPIEEWLMDWRADIQSMIVLLRTNEPLHDIKLPRIKGVVESLQRYIGIFGSVVDRERYLLLDETEVVSLENACKSVSTVYKSLNQALRWARTAYRALEVIENNVKDSNSFDVDLMENYFRCLDECDKALATALRNA